MRHSNWTEIIRSNKFDLILYSAFPATIVRTFSLPFSLLKSQNLLYLPISWANRYCIAQTGTTSGLRVISESKSICPNLNYTMNVWPPSPSLSQQLLLQFLSTTIWFSPRAEHKNLFFLLLFWPAFWSQALCKHFNQWTVKSTFVRCGDTLSSEHHQVENSAKKIIGIGESVCWERWSSRTYCLRLPFDYSLRYMYRPSNEFNRIDCKSANGEWVDDDWQNIACVWVCAPNNATETKNETNRSETRIEKFARRHRLNAWTRVYKMRW